MTSETSFPSTGTKKWIFIAARAKAAASPYTFNLPLGNDNNKARIVNKIMAKFSPLENLKIEDRNRSENPRYSNR
jgi:hypothetical protein